MFDDRVESLVKSKISPDEFILKYNHYQENIERKKSEANQVLTQFRLERTRKELPKTKMMKNLKIDSNDNTPGKVGIIDVLAMDKANMAKEPKLHLPPANDNLWVVRPIGKHDPPDYNDDNSSEVKRLVFSPNDPAPTSKNNLVPTSAVEKKECEMSLDGSMLKKIIVGPKEINFGEIFKGSEKRQTFWVFNNLRYRIFIEFYYEQASYELARRYFLR